MEKRTTTPKELTDQIKSFCSEILTDVQPIYIPIQPIENGQYGECYKNVQNAINAMGGKRILGWNIWWWANILLEAEAHAIWENPNGEYVDVTPQRDGEKQILFLPDASLSYEGHLIKSVRQPLTNSPLVADFIRITSELEEIKQHSSGNTVALPGELVERYMWLLSIFKTKVGRNDPCPCQSGLKYKKCCGQ
ncbi:MAG: SEC-C metal-binding domain-containing protein [Oscillospiraceae bacterium]